MLSQKSMNINILILQHFKIENFLHIYPSECLNSSSYQKEKSNIEQLKVVNDSAERGVKFVEDFKFKYYKKQNSKIIFITSENKFLISTKFK